MCFLCDGGTLDELMRQIASDIDQNGWHVCGVTSEARAGDWAYTIGLTETYGHPELVMTGLCCFACAHSTLNGIGGLIADGARFGVGEEARSKETEGSARFGYVHPRHWQTNRFNMWRNYYEGKPWTPEPVALQVITRGERSGWQDAPTNLRWRFERLDRALHLGPRGGRR